MTNAVAPGFAETAMIAEVAARVGIPFDDMKNQAIAGTVVGRVGKPEDIAHALAFFVDECSSYVTVQVLNVAGGPKR